MSKWHQENKERHRESLKAWRHNNPRNMMLKGARARSKASGMECTIELADIPEIPEVCPILLTPFVHSYNTRGPGPNSPSLDRVNSRRGYIPGNVRIISHKANAIKAGLTLEEVERVLAYMKGAI